MSSNFPPPGEQEILDSSGGDPQDVRGARPSRKAALAAGGILAGVVIVGGAAWAASWYLSSGADAAEMLPDSTLAFAQVNLDPSGEQKIEALKTLNKFPAIRSELDLSSSSDVRKSLFEQIQKDGTCEDVDYDTDIAPWLGNRMAIAAIDTGEATPAPVGIVEITDEDKAKAGIDTLMNCGDDSGSGGIAIEGDWVVLAETDAIADDVVSDALESNLADDASYQRWMDEAGGDGIMSAYIAPSAAVKLADALPGLLDSSGVDSEAALTDDQTQELKDFEGAAMKLRFVDGSVEAEFAGDRSNNPFAKVITASEGADVVGSLPVDTAFALGASLGEGWLQTYLDEVAGALGSGDDLDAAMAEIEDQTGLALPEDIEALTGESFALAVSSDIDVDALSNADDFSDVGVGMKVKGDPDAAEATLEKLRAQLPDESWLLSKSSGDYLSFGPDQDWLDALSEDGGLGASSDYQQVIPQGDKSIYVVYANADAGDDWLVNALKDSGAEDDVIDNVAPLGAFGFSLWVDDDAVHASIKLSTD
ncbi:DUF3352 domain-containing protein [Nocardioides sp.]|uniref:DUF3352 domain-containing protein n=1 Tax=Nocardioides sp. TaxID=35761 RepID=UPI003D0B5769